MALNIPNSMTDLTALRSAITNENVEETKAILEHLTDIPQKDLDFALSYATSPTDEGWEGNLEIITALMSRGAQVNENTFLFACAEPSIALFQTLLNSGWNINSVDFGQPAIRLLTDNETLLRWFLQQGADPNVRGSKRDISVLATAAQYPNLAVLELLLYYGAVLDPTALVRAMAPGHRGGGLQVMKFLIDRGIDLNGLLTKCGTPLHFAVNLNDKEKTELLIAGGADRTIQNVSGMTPLEWAKDKGYTDLVKLLEE